jgi:hypothetical protein
MDVQAYVGHVVDVLAGDEPDDFTDLAFGEMPGHAGKRIGVDLLLPGELRDIVKSGALGVGEQRAIAVLLERIEFGLVHRGFDGERTTDIDAKEANVGASYLFPNEHDRLRWQLQLFVQLADLCVELTESNRQPRECTFSGVSTLPNCLRVKKYASFIINPLGFSIGGRNVPDFVVSIVMLAILVLPFPAVFDS